MTAEVAIYNFFESFGINVRPEGSIFASEWKTELPCIILPDFTYNTGGERQERCVEIWCRDGLDWRSPRRMEESIAKAIPLSGRSIEFEGGAIYLRRGKPFSKPLLLKDGGILRGIKIFLTYEYINPMNRLRFTLGGSTVTVGDDSRIIVGESLCGGRAEAVSGNISVDCIGRRTEISASTDWFLTGEINRLCAMVAESPIMNIEYPYDGGSGIVSRTGDFVVGMPVIKEVSRDGRNAGFCKAEIKAISRGVVE